MKYRIQKINDRKVVLIGQYALVLHEDRVDVEVDGEVVDQHVYVDAVRKVDALENIIYKYHEIVELPF